MTFAALRELGRGDPVNLQPVGGGCIAEARIATFADGYRVFVKSAEGLPGMFECEAKGLSALAAAGAIRTPEVLAVGDGALVLEAIIPGPRRPDFFEVFGRRFARLHSRQGPFFGFDGDNFIGSTAQRNTPVGAGDDWPGFFVERRLRFQVELAERNGHGSELRECLESGEAHIREIIGAAAEPPSLLHGDLWGGNYMVDDRGSPCLIDPAVYYGHREADLAMTRLFGGFPPPFYAAYTEAWPLEPGHAERLPLYQLYHLLNHLNLFGGAYYRQCRQILAPFARRRR